MRAAVEVGRGAGDVTVRELIRGRLVLIGLRAREPQGAIAELVDFLVAEGELEAPRRDQAVAAAYGRERLRPTGTELGVALPHGVTDAVGEEVAAIGISRRGIPFACLDGRPAHIVILVLTPPRRKQARVHSLARIAALANDAAARRRLVAARTREAALRLLGRY